MSQRKEDLDRFYGLLAELEGVHGGKKRLADCTAQSGWPRRGG